MKSNIKAFIVLTLITSISLTFVSKTCHAGGWKDLKKSLKSEKNKKAVEELAKQALTQEKPSGNTTHKAQNSSQRTQSSSQPNPQLRSDILKCDNIDLTNVQIGDSTSYQVTEGLSKSKYTGFINRRKASVSNQCFIGVLDSKECATIEVSKDQLSKITQGDRNNLTMQCVYSNNPSEMAIQEVPYKADNIPLNYMLLKCGHDQGSEYPCDEGSNSTRSGKYKKQLKDKVQLSVCGTTFHQVPKGGQYIYCQYYNKKSKKSVFAFEFLQTPN